MRFRQVLLFGLLVAAIIFAVLVGGYLATLPLRLRIALADEQTAIFDDMRVKAERADATETLGYLEYTLGYYPSGTKQIEGSQLDRIVERARQNALREIIAALRARTGKDFGDDPQHWLDELREAK
jgi:hypothetical protein